MRLRNECPPVNVSGGYIRQKVSQRSHCYCKGSSYCRPHQLSRHMDQAAPDGGFSGHTLLSVLREKQQLRGYMLSDQILRWHSKAPWDQRGYLEHRVLLLEHVMPEQIINTWRVKPTDNCNHMVQTLNLSYVGRDQIQ